MLEYRRRHPVSLAGNGLIRTTCKKYLSDNDAGWMITDNDMLVTGGYSPSDHALVVDTAPRRPTVSLFQIKSIAGYTYANWTPIMVTFEQLFVDFELTIPPDTFKQQFKDTKCERCIVRSILYLKGGFNEGDWNWGGNSRTTAALLWKEAWEYFKMQN